MEKLKPTQILLEISKDKKELTVGCGSFPYPITLELCPALTIDAIPEAIETAAHQVGFDEFPGWEKEKCGYEGGNCLDCN